MNNKKEIRGIYNTTFNDKLATPILKEVEAVENAIIEVITMYVKGYHNIKRDKGAGAEHIKIHLDENEEGAISIEELVLLGNSLRKYLSIFKEPFIKTINKKIYEWQNKDGVRFRAVTGKILTTKGEGHTPPLSPSSDFILTFYSDRNLKNKMQFENPQVEAFYQNPYDFMEKVRIQAVGKLGRMLFDLLSEFNKNFEITDCDIRETQEHNGLDYEIILSLKNAKNEDKTTIVFNFTLINDETMNYGLPDISILREAIRDFIDTPDGEGQPPASSGNKRRKP